MYCIALQDGWVSFPGCIRDVKLRNLPLVQPTNKVDIQQCSNAYELGSFFPASGGYLQLCESLLLPSPGRCWAVLLLLSCELVFLFLFCLFTYIFFWLKYFWFFVCCFFMSEFLSLWANVKLYFHHLPAVVIVFHFCVCE